MTNIVPPLCCFCLRARFGITDTDPEQMPGLSCEAFPLGIPQRILTGEVDHHKAVLGDRGLRFQQKPGLGLPEYLGGKGVSVIDLDLYRKFNPHHDRLGRFAAGGSGGGFRSANSISEAEQFAKDNLIEEGGMVSYAHAPDLDTANALNERVYQLEQEYGVKPDVLAFNPSLNDNCMGQSSTGYSHGKVSATLEMNGERNHTKENVSLTMPAVRATETAEHAAHQTVSATYQDYITHEYGHVLQAKRDHKRGPATRPGNVGNHQEWRDAKRDLPENPVNRRYALSHYAMTNDRELFAEAFVLYQRGELKAKMPSMVDYIEKLKRPNGISGLDDWFGGV